jgi:hypothetical protein
MSTSTLYPSIRTKLPEILHDLQFIPSFTSISPSPPTLSITGTVKLHGTHADILIYPDNAIILQSRNCVNISTTSDNHGFAAAMATKSPVLHALRDQYLERYKELNPDAQLDPHAPMTLAGEWIGIGVQKGVALVHLSRRFVIVSVQINSAWVRDALYADLCNEDADIFNVSRATSYSAVINLMKPEAAEEQLQNLADAVAASCPFAKTFGVEGEGEGIVWKFDAFPHESRVWFKSKGGKFKPNYGPRPKKLPPSNEVAGRRRAMQKLVNGYAKAWCSEGRMEQGWDYLREVGVERDRKGAGRFLEWVVGDVCREEKWDIEEMEMDVGMLKRAVTDIAKPWYVEKSGVALIG